MSAQCSGRKNALTWVAFVRILLTKSLARITLQSRLPRAWLGMAAVALSAVFPSFNAAAAGAQYVYDNGGRLVQVIAPDGSSAQYTYDPAGNILSIKRIASTALAETGTSVASGAVGSTLTIYGSGFSTTASSNQVWINGVLCTVVSSTANSIMVIVPAGATSGPIKITVAGTTVTSTASFNVAAAIPAPTISSVNPTIAAAGASVTITGSNFQASAANNKVTFARSSASISAATVTSITTVVPAGYPSGHISVSTPYGTSASTQDLFVPPNGHVAADVAATGRITVGGPATNVTLSAAGKIGMVLFDGQQGQQVSLQLSNQSFQTNCAYGSVVLLGPSPGNTAIGFTNFCTGAVRVALPTTGTYTLIFTPGSASDTGSVTIKVANAAPVLMTTTIGGSAVTATTTVPAQQAMIAFTTSMANQVVSVQVVSETYPTNCYSATLSIIGPSPSTTPVGNTNICPGAARFTLGAAGTYRILVAPAGSDTGSITLKLFNATPVGGPIVAGGSAVVVTTTAPAQQGILTFSSTVANQVVSIQASAQTYPSNCNYGSIVITGPSPATTYNGSMSFCAGASRFTLGAAGTYTIVVTANAADTGSISLQLYNATPVTASPPIGGSALVVTTTVPAQQAILTFATTVANEVVSLQVSAQTYASNCNYGSIQILGPSPATTQVASTSFCSGANAFTLAAIGTYTIVLTPNGADTGSITLQIYNTTPWSQTVSANGTATTMSITVPTQQGRLSFSGTSGQRISLQVSNDTLNGTGGFFALTLLNPDGSTAYNNGLTSGPTFGPFTLTQTGTFTFVVNPYGAGTGSLTLQVNTVPPDLSGPIPTNGTATTMTVGTPGQGAAYTFSGTAGQRISFTATSSTLTNSWYDVTILNPDGGTLKTFSAYGSTAFNGPITLVQSGTHTLKIVPEQWGTGSLVVEIYIVPPDISAAISTNGSATTMTATTPGQGALYTFSGTAGQRISFVATSNTLTSNWYDVTILNPDGSTLKGFSAYGSTTFNGPTTLTQSGTHTLKIVPESGGTGTLTQKLYILPADATTASPGDGSAVTQTSTTPGQGMDYTFSGVAGQMDSFWLSFSLTPSGECPNMTVYNPDGSTFQNLSYICGSPKFFGPYTLTQTGTFKVIVSDSGGGTGTATLQRYIVPADVSASVAVNGSAVTQTMGTPGQGVDYPFSGTSGHQVTINLTYSLTPSGDCPGMTLYNPDGSVVQNWSYICGSGVHSTGALTLAQSGTFKVVVADTGGGTGTATVSLTGN